MFNKIKKNGNGSLEQLKLKLNSVKDSGLYFFFL